MFESYDRGRAYRRRKAFVAPGIFLVVGALMVVQVRSVWSISKLAMPRANNEVFAISDRASPPPPKLGGGDVVKHVAPKPIKTRVTAVVQPVIKQPDPTETVTKSGIEAPPGPGTPDGDKDGELDGMGAGPACGKPGLPSCGIDLMTDIEPPSVLPPQTIAPTTFRANRIAGNEQIQPDDMTKLEISRAGKSRLLASVKVCVDGNGHVASASKIGGGTGFAAYDAKILAAVRQWQYKPFLVNGNPAPTCSVVQFIYVQP